MSSFETLVPDRRFLDLRNSADAERKSLVLPELPSGDEIREISRLFPDNNQFDIWSYQFGHDPDYHNSNSIEAMTQIYEEENSNSFLIRLVNAEVFLWIPGEHEYFVVFGSPGKIDLVMSARIFEYSFSEYLEDSIARPKLYQHLSEVQKKYSSTHPTMSL